MNHKDLQNIDKLAKEALKDFEVPFNAEHWIEFEAQLKKEHAVDDVARNAFAGYEVSFDENEWSKLEKKLDNKEHLYPHIWKVKAVEVGIIALFVFTFVNLKPYTSKIITTTNTTNDNNSTFVIPSEDNNNKNVNIFNLPSVNENNNSSENSVSDKPVASLEEIQNIEKNATSTNRKNSAISNNGGRMLNTTASNQRVSDNNPTVLSQENRIVEENNSLGKFDDLTLTQDASNSVESTSSEIENTTEFNLTQNTSRVQLLDNNLDALSAEGYVLENNYTDPIFELKKAETAMNYKCRVHIGGQASADANISNSLGETSIGYTAGAFLDIECSPRVFIRSGLNVSHKKYFNTKNYLLDNTLVDGNIYNIEEEKTTNLIVLQVPVDVQYIFFKNEKWRIFASAGATANLITGRIYQGQLSTNLGYLSVSTDINATDLEKGAIQGGDLQQNFYLSVGGGIGLERQLGDNISLFLLPSYKHAVTPIGTSKDYIGTFSLNVGLKSTLK